MDARVLALMLLVMVGSLPATHAAGTPLQLQRCAIGASAHYQVPLPLVLAVLRQEGGRQGFVSKNTNSTEDLGPMQINSRHLGELAKFGISRDRLIHDGCLNVYIGTWMLKREIVQAGNLWRGVGNYHSRTPSLNVQYQWLVWGRLKQLEAGR